jgi:hypothetical protein
VKRSSVSDLDFLVFWDRLRESVDRANQRRRQEIENSWAVVRGLLEDQCQRIRQPLPALTPPTLARLAQVHSAIAERFLGDCLRARDRSRPFRRVFAALDEHERAMQSLLRSLPEHLHVAPRKAVRALAEKLQNPSGRWISRLLRNRSVPFALRETVTRHLSDERARFRRVESAFVTLLTSGLREVHFSWNVTCLTVSQAWVRRISPQGDQVEDSIRKRLLILDDQYHRLITEWKKADESAADRLGKAFSSAFSYPRLRTPSEDPKQLYEDHWSEQLHAVDGELRLDNLVQECVTEMLAVLGATFDSIRLDHAKLLGELDSVLAWLSHPEGGDFPLPRAEVIPASSREAEIRNVMRAVSSRLPQQFDLVRRLSAKPGGLAFRRVAARMIFQRALSTQYPMVREVLDGIESEQRSVLAEIERAREVYAFGIEMSHSGQVDEVQLAQDAIGNAGSLLRVFRSELGDWSPSAEAEVSKAAAAIMAETDRGLLAGAVLRAARITGQEVRRTGTLALRRGAQVSGKLRQAGAGKLRELVNGLLVAIGWRAPTSEGKAEVVVRIFLPEEFTRDLTTEEIPRLYRHLFRFEPVQDPRLLIGRERELSAISEARRLWEGGRPVSVIIIGERGSGKTSLINGAAKRCLEGLDIVRSEFSERVASSGGMNRFLADLLAVTDVEQSLSKNRKVVILEELERIFLREIGGFEGVESLQRLITATSASTFWILCVNEVAFRFLNGAVGLGSTFSHRVYAGTASREDLREAIMVRHRLSGLRLRFPSTPEASPLSARLGLSQHRRRGETDPETLFFDRLSEQSGGVYRTAFEIWLGQVESVQAGVLYMRPLVKSDYSAIVDDLTPAHLFTLVAVMQHGGLTADEHAEVFGEPTTSSLARLDDLVSRQLLEQDPGHPGFRVRPEATRLVKAALYARNLL